MKNSANFKNAVVAAKKYNNLNWKVLPVDPKSKSCHMKGWQNFKIEAEDIPAAFIEPCNVGILLGASMLTDVDIDSTHAHPFLKWLPSTGAIWGRPGNPNSHHLYEGECQSRSFKNSSGAIIEIRSHGCYAVLPPSVHPEEESYNWESFGKPGKGDSLEQAVTKIFIAATLSIYWKTGVRHDLALAISGLLLKAGWVKDDVLDFVVTVAKAAGDNEIDDRKTAVNTTADNFLVGLPVSGYSKLVDILGEQDANAIGKLLGTNEPDLNELVAGAVTIKGKKSAAHLICKDLMSRGVFYKTKLTADLLFFHQAERELYTLGSAEFRAFCGELYDINGKEPVWSYIEEQVQQYCLRKGKLTEIFLFSRYQKDKLYIHAGGQRVYRLDGDNIDEISNGDDGILFKSDPSLASIYPDYNFMGSPVRDHLVNITNAVDPDRLDLYETLIYSMFFESRLPTKPIVLLTGPKGSGKTSAGRALKRAFHGSAADVDSGMASKEDAFWAGICHNSLVCIDNVDTLIPWLADNLALVATGGKYQRRKLHETNTLMEYQYRCFVIVTSRNPQSFTRDDVVDRLLLIEVERRKDFKEESYLLAQIEAQRPKIWGELLTNLNKMVDRLKKPMSTSPMPYRMADWARLAICFAPMLGIDDVEKKLKAMEASKVEFALDDHPLVTALEAWIALNPEEDFISSGDLFKAISQRYEEKNEKFGINSAKAFGVQLRNLRSELETRYKIEDKKGTGNKRLYRFRIIEQDASQQLHEKEIMESTT